MKSKFIWTCIFMIGQTSIPMTTSAQALDGTKWSLDSIHTYFFGDLIRRNSSEGIWEFNTEGKLNSQLSLGAKPVQVDFKHSNDTIYADQRKIVYYIERRDKKSMVLRIVSYPHDSESFIRYFFTAK